MNFRRSLQVKLVNARVAETFFLAIDDCSDNIEVDPSFM